VGIRSVNFCPFWDERFDPSLGYLEHSTRSSPTEVAFFQQHLNFCQQGWTETFVRLQKTIDELEPVAEPA
jgi:hypothetical protein